jgi:hypothetical protein
MNIGKAGRSLPFIFSIHIWMGPYTQSQGTYEHRNAFEVGKTGCIGYGGKESVEVREAQETVYVVGRGPKPGWEANEHRQSR